MEKILKFIGRKNYFGKKKPFGREWQIYIPDKKRRAVFRRYLEYTRRGPFCFPNENSCLALAELELSSCTALTDFPFNHAGVAGQKAVSLERRMIVNIHLGQRTGNSVAAGSGLSVKTAAGNCNDDVDLVSLAVTMSGWRTV